MKNLCIFLSLFSISNAFCSDQEIKLTQQDLKEFTSATALETRKVELVASVLNVQLELSDADANVVVTIVDEGIGSSCSYKSPIQKTISRDWAEAKIEIQFSGSTHSSEDSYCLVSVHDKKSNKGIILKLKEFN